MTDRATTTIAYHDDNTATIHHTGENGPVLATLTVPEAELLSGMLWCFFVAHRLDERDRPA